MNITIPVTEITYDDLIAADLSALSQQTGLTVTLEEVKANQFAYAAAIENVKRALVESRVGCLLH